MGRFDSLDGSQNILSTSAYDAWGNPLAPGTGDPFGYCAEWGYYTDSETSLLLLTHRYYDPGQGRFVTRDPIGYSGGVNLYGYVGNGVTGGIDWSGYITFSAGVGGVGMIGIPEYGVPGLNSSGGGAVWGNGSVFISIPHFNDVIHPGNWRVGLALARGSGYALGNGLAWSGGISLGLSKGNPQFGYSHSINTVLGGFCENWSLQGNKDDNGWENLSGGLGRWGRGEGSGGYGGRENDWSWTWSLGQAWNSFVYYYKNAYIDYHYQI